MAAKKTAARVETNGLDERIQQQTDNAEAEHPLIKAYSAAYRACWECRRDGAKPDRTRAVHNTLSGVSKELAGYVDSHHSHIETTLLHALAVAMKDGVTWTPAPDPMTPTKVWESTKTLREQCWLLVERIAGVLQAPPMKPQGKKVKVERRRNPQQERATQELREKIHKAHKPGKKITAIAREVICDRRTARRHLQDLGLYDEANE